MTAQIIGFPPWVQKGLIELGDHVAEYPGLPAHPRIVFYDSFTTLKATSDEVAWCAAFVCAMLEISGVKSTKSAAAGSFLQWGVPLEEPIPGAIAVYGRTGGHHVNFWIGRKLGFDYGLGGNQSNQVSIGRQPVERLLGYRAPSTVELQAA